MTLAQTVALPPSPSTDICRRPIRLVMAADPKELEELVMAGAVEKLLSLVTLEEVAKAWCNYQTRPHLPGADDL
ncbi:MAG TPA: hypothetical protein VF232_03525 [Gaiellaceae bacterium]